MNTHDWDGSLDYVTDPKATNVRHDYSYEDTLIAEVRRLETEVATLKATIGMVRKAIDMGGDPARIARNLDTV